MCLATPNGIEEIRRVFGHPEEKGWGPANLALIRLPSPLPIAWDLTVTARRAMVHKVVAPAFEDVFEDIFYNSLWHDLKTWGGTYAHRSKASVPGELSLHAYGIAVDVDVLNNRMGEEPKINPEIVRIFERHGFVWGGRWERPDGMHFQFARGY